jgi:hypothetical protein
VVSLLRAGHVLGGTTTIGIETKCSFEIPPYAIPNSEITNTIKTEIVIIGARTAGLLCANAAVDNRAKIVLISASSVPVSRGGSNHVIDSKAK